MTDREKLMEEPVSEDLEKIVEEIAEPTILNAYGTKELARRLRNTICGTFVSEDLKLTWEDMMLIHKCIKDAMNYHLYKMMEGVEGQKVVYQEVLKRYREMKLKDKL